jgi:predicted urease superfamily metal-dependent hydrolase
MSKIVTQLQLAEIAQVSQGEIKNLAKLLATEVLGIHPAEWNRMVIRHGSTYRSLFMRRQKKTSVEAT